ncbi:MAG: TrmB family transcriptional regulator [Firmicutes bacterium HGW-Firmicutes-1]|jgi:sugar-specific transcriptional regulator TrmB|nr:MAG: TrmB family transcriptional regulator [Firmicutes bacterium HGW-Firmicutes-1]
MLLNSLKKIGFTQQEAIIYIHLCKNSELTGYEAAKLSGISRSNAYAALSSLVDKGYAYLIEGASSKYIAVPKEELIKNAERDFQTNINVIRENLTFTSSNQEPYITITGEHHIVSKFKNIIESAEKRIYISCDKEVIHLLEHDLKAAIANNLKVVILSPSDLTDAAEHIYYPTEPNDSIKLIADTKEVIAGNFKQCLYSKNSTLLSLIRESFINEIAVIDHKNNR